MKIKYPKYIQRIDDGEIFVRLDDGKYYVKALIEQFPNHFHFGYSYNTLMINNKRNFKHFNK